MRILVPLALTVLLATAQIQAKDKKSEKLSTEAMQAKIEALQETNDIQEITLILIERNNFEREAQARYASLTERFNAKMKPLCEKKQIPITQCQFDGNKRQVVKVEPPPVPTKK
jgi:hypothetical protein